MTIDAGDLPLFEHTRDIEPRPIPDALRRARSQILAAVDDLLAIPEGALPKPWPWKGGSEEEVRYAAYRAGEALEQAEREARRALLHRERREAEAAQIIAPATAARWDLHGLLAPLDERTIDDDPPGEEWSIRLVLGHVISGQRAYGWGSAWWQSHPHAAADPHLPTQIPDPFWLTLPDEATVEAAGTLRELRARLDHVLDRSTERLAAMPDERLAYGARWSGFPVTVGFRLGRWSSHIREHTIQVEKTLAMLGRTPTEPERLARHVLAAFGRAEEAVYGRAVGDDAIEPLLSAAAEASSAISDARRAAGR